MVCDDWDNPDPPAAMRCARCKSRLVPCDYRAEHVCDCRGYVHMMGVRHRCPDGEWVSGGPIPIPEPEPDVA